jgi:hypothetical protein
MRRRNDTPQRGYSGTGYWWFGYPTYVGSYGANSATSVTAVQGNDSPVAADTAGFSQNAIDAGLA